VAKSRWLRIQSVNHVFALTLTGAVVVVAHSTSAAWAVVHASFFINEPVWHVLDRRVFFASWIRFSVGVASSIDLYIAPPLPASSPDLQSLRREEVWTVSQCYRRFEAGVRMALMKLSDFKHIPTEQLMEMARALPGGRKVDLPDRVTTIAFLLGTRAADLN